MTALHLACGMGHTGTAELLIAKGADVEAEDEVRQGDKGDGEAMRGHAQTATAIVGAEPGGQ